MLRVAAEIKIRQGQIELSSVSLRIRTDFTKRSQRHKSNELTRYPVVRTKTIFELPLFATVECPALGRLDSPKGGAYQSQNRRARNSFVCLASVNGWFRSHGPSQSEYVSCPNRQRP